MLFSEKALKKTNNLKNICIMVLLCLMFDKIFVIKSKLFYADPKIEGSNFQILIRVNGKIMAFFWAGPPS